MRLIWILTLLITMLLGALAPLPAQAAWPTYTVLPMFDAPMGPDEIRRALAVDASGVQLMYLDNPGPSAGYLRCQASDCTVATSPVGNNDWTVSNMSDFGVLTGSIYQGFEVAFVGNNEIGYDRAGCPGCGFSLDSQALGANVAGMATGWAEFAAGGSPRAFRYTAAGMADLGTLGGSTSEGRAINALGQVAGYSALAGNLLTHAFRHSNGQMTDLGSLGGAGASSYAFDINDSGKVVGCSYNAAPLPVLQAFRHNGSSMVALPPLAVGKSACARAINNADVAVGYAYNASGAQRAVMFKGQQVRSLNQLLAPGSSGWTLLEATGINDSGVIVGNGVYNGVVQPFVLLP